MIASLSFFIISFIGMVLVFFSNRFYKIRPFFLKKSDDLIIKLLAEIKKAFLFINKKTIGLLAHYILEEVEIFSNKVFRKLKRIVKK